MAIVLLRTRLRVVLCALAAALALVAPGLPSAHAIPTNSPVDTVSLGGEVVYDLVVLDSGRVIVGGRFTAVGSYTRSNVGAILANGNADPDFAPTTNGEVHAIAAAENGSRIFIGGSFTEVNGQPRHNLAAIDAVTGALVGGWRADTDGRNPTVRSLAVRGGRLYVGGKFNEIDGVAKQKLAAIDVAFGHVLHWSTWLNGGVNELRVAPDGTVWVGGEFTKIRGQNRPYVGGIDPDTGHPTGFVATGNDSRVITLGLSSDGAWLYTGNNSNRVNAYQPVQSGTPRWTRRPDGNTQGFAVSGTQVYLCGHMKGFPDDGSVHRYFAALNRSTGATAAWDPRATGFFKGCWSLAIDSGDLYAVGGFTKFDGVSQRLFARFGGTA